MSLYRDAGRIRRRRRLYAALTAAALIALALAVIGLVRQAAPSDAERAGAARSAAATALDGLELLEIEYAQAVDNGDVTAPTEYAAAQAAVRRAQDAIRDHADDIAVVDTGAAPAALQALDRVAAAVARRADPTRVRAAVAAARSSLRFGQTRSGSGAP